MRKNKVFLAICAILCVMLAMTACQPNGGNGLIIIGNQNGGNSHQRLANEQLMEEINLPAIVSLITDGKVSDPPKGMEIKLDTGDSSERSIIPYSTNGEPLIEGGTVASYLVSFNGEGYTAGSLTITAGQLRVTFSSGTDGNSYEIDVVAQIVAHETDHERFSYSVDVQTTTAGTGIKGSFDGTMSVSATGEATFSGVTTVTLDITSTITINGSAVNASGAQGDGSQNNPYVFSTAEQLFAFAKGVNDGTIGADSHVVLDADIDLGGKEWTPIGFSVRTGKGYTDESKPFTGLFNGNDHLISGLYISKTTEKEDDSTYIEGVGFFSGLGGDAKVEHVRIGGTINVPTNESAGFIAGLMNGNAVVDSCTVVVGSTVTAKEAGGVIGRMLASGTISNTVNNSTVEAAGGKAGGIVNAAYYDQNPSSTADFDYLPFAITNCENNGKVTGISYVGGIAGLAGPVTISGTTNNGAVTGQTQGIGGIAGQSYSGTIIDGCWNHGEVSATGVSPVGGIVGWMRYLDATNYNTSLRSEVRNSHNVGKVVSGNSDAYGTGGVIGLVYWSGLFEDCSSSGEVKTASGNMAGGFAGGVQYLSSGESYEKPDGTATSVPDVNGTGTRKNGVEFINCKADSAKIINSGTGTVVGGFIGHCVNAAEAFGEKQAFTTITNCTPNGEGSGIQDWQNHQ